MSGKKGSLIKGKPSRLGGGRRRDGYILRIWMGASAGPFSSKPAITRQPLSVTGLSPLLPGDGQDQPNSGVNQLQLERHRPPQNGNGSRIFRRA